MELTIELPVDKAATLIKLVQSGDLRVYDVIGAKLADHSRLATKGSASEQEHDATLFSEDVNLFDSHDHLSPATEDQQEQLPVLETNFPILFRDYMLKSVEHVLEQIEGIDDSTLPPDERDKALHVLSYALDYPPAWPTVNQILLLMSPKMEQEGYRDDWIPFLEQGIEKSHLLEDSPTEAALRLELGIIYQLRSKLDTAIEQFRLSTTGFDLLGDRLNQARALNRWAYAARLQRQHDEAIQLIQQAQALLSEDGPEQAYNYFVQGTIAFDELAWEQAADFFQRSLQLWQREHNERMIAWSLSNLGVAMYALKRYTKAIDHFETAIAMLEEINDPVFQAVTRMNLGNVHLDLKQPQDALDLYTKAEVIFRNALDEWHLAMVYTNMGLAYRDLKNWSWAKLALLEGIEGWQQLGNTKSLVNAIEELGVLYLHQGMYERAVTKFHDALNQLAQIKNEPGYTALLESLTAHLSEAQAKLQDKQPMTA